MFEKRLLFGLFLLKNHCRESAILLCARGHIIEGRASRAVIIFRGPFSCPHAEDTVVFVHKLSHENLVVTSAAPMNHSFPLRNNNNRHVHI